MSRRRLTLWLGPPIALVVAGLALGRLQPSAEAGGGPTAGPGGACAGSPVEIDPRGRPDRGAGLGAWWSMAGRLDDAGTLVGRSLALGRGQATSMVMDLPADALASGPLAGVVAVTTDDGSQSRVSLASAARACTFLVREVADVARGAILDPADGSVIVHLLDRASRADLGTWRIGVDGATAPTLVAAGLGRDARGQATWTTDLRLAADGLTLAVQSCRDDGCITRLFDPAMGAAAVARIDVLHGPLIGVTAQALVAWAACVGFPCPIERWDVATGQRTILVDHAESAGMSADGRYLVAITDAGRGGIVRVDLVTGGADAIRGLGGTERLLAGGVNGTAGLAVNDGELALGGAGTIPRPFDPAAAEVLR